MYTAVCPVSRKYFSKTAQSFKAQIPWALIFLSCHSFSLCLKNKSILSKVSLVKNSLQNLATYLGICRMYFPRTFYHWNFPCVDNFLPSSRFWSFLIHYLVHNGQTENRKTLNSFLCSSSHELKTQTHLTLVLGCWLKVSSHLMSFLSYQFLKKKNRSFWTWCLMQIVYMRGLCSLLQSRA